VLLGTAALERERANPFRYFSSNVVDELSRNDEPLKQILNHNVAAMFVDIVGVTAYAADRHPEEAIETLRQFHGRMEQAVFAHKETLDKYLGDGSMATFGTPVATDRDGIDALDRARDGRVNRRLEHRTTRRWQSGYPGEHRSPFRPCGLG